MSSIDTWTDGLVNSLKEVRANALRFWNDGQLPEASHAWKTLSQFQHWYYFEDLDIFAPSKFIGYAGTTVENYYGAGHGTYTCQRLEEWFEPVKRPSPEFTKLCAKLEAFLGDNGKKLSSKVVKTTGAIYVLKSEYRKSPPDKTETSPAGASSKKPAKPPKPISKKEAEYLETVAQAMVTVRRHQDKFRDKLLAGWNGQCPVSGCRNPGLLRASHIKPWAVCDNTERLDPNNGLLLAAHLDAAFDRGLISFEDSGEVLLSSLLSPIDRSMLGLPLDFRLSLGEGHLVYLKHHREKVFRP